MIYEDGAVQAQLLEDAATLGHVQVTPQDQAQTLEGMGREQAVQLFFASSFAATALFETMGAHGTNIVVQEGDGVVADVFARQQDDGLGLQWQPEQADRDALEQTAKKIKDAFWYVGKDVDDSNDQEVVSRDEPDEVAASAEDYRVKQLSRSP